MSVRIVRRICHATSSHTEHCSRRAASVGGISRFSFARKSPRAPVELRNAPRAPHTRDLSNMLCTARALAFTAPARRGGTERRVAASPRITSAPATTSRRFGKYLRGASGNKALVGCHVSASEAPTTRARADGRERSSPEPTSPEPSLAGALLRRVRKALLTFAVGIALTFANAAPALAGVPGKSEVVSFHGTATTMPVSATGAASLGLLGPSFAAMGGGHHSVATMKNLPVAVGDVGSIGMLAPSGIGIPYNGNNPGVALFMASGGVAVRMLINVVVIYAIHKYWMNQ